MNQQLFDYFYNEHNVTLLVTDIQEIERLVKGDEIKQKDEEIKKLYGYLQRLLGFPQGWQIEEYKDVYEETKAALESVKHLL